VAAARSTLVAPYKQSARHLKVAQFDGTHILSAGGNLNLVIWSSGGCRLDKQFQMLHSRRIIFHLGAPKTGTSAIQRFLASNIENFRDIGLDYLNGEPPRGELHTTGNGLPIFLYFDRAEAEPKKLESLIDGHFRTQRTAIVSSELLSSIPVAGWQNIIDACQAQSITPFVIYYVRNVYPFYVSSYNQLVKHNGTTDSFEEFVELNSVFACADRLHFLTELIGPERLTIAHYESEKEYICEHFFSLIAPTADTSHFEFHATRVNRSLDEPELRLMRIANRFPKAHFPGELANILVSAGCSVISRDVFQLQGSNAGRPVMG
jgi:hypothetical protein